MEKEKEIIGTENEQSCEDSSSSKSASKSSISYKYNVDEKQEIEKTKKVTLLRSGLILLDQIDSGNLKNLASDRVKTNMKAVDEKSNKKLYHLIMKFVEKTDHQLLYLSLLKENQ